MDSLSISLIVDDELSLNWLNSIILSSAPRPIFSKTISVLLYPCLFSSIFFFKYSKLIGLASKEIIFFIIKFFENNSIDSPLCAPISIRSLKLLFFGSFICKDNLTHNYLNI